ncbi:Glycine--tRNA ligase beta subunit [Buchnera aphidicola (Thelaxes suberi)]|uniref:glycine--tRNA ligase subunit beta n=1 Tax=Buchnera aphidicola TaxID=9 RepID=UPI0034642CB3
MKKTLLIEIYTEEIPHTELKNIILSLYNNIIKELKQFNIQYEKIKWYASPRRLGIKIYQIVMERKIKKKKIIGPSTKIAINKEKKLNHIGLSWVKKYNIDKNKIFFLQNNQGSWVAQQSFNTIENVKNVLPEIIHNAINHIKLTRTMKWNNNSISFIRPVRNILAMIDDKILKIKIFELYATNYTYGHFFMNNSKIFFQHAKEYPALLFNKGKVLVDFFERKKNITNQIEKKLNQLNGAININQNLLDEITSLVEYPVTLVGKFQKEYLNIPHEIIINILQKYQKHIPVYINNQLSNYFLIISNIVSSNNQAIITGNQKIVHAKLFDAQFFLKQDQKFKLINNLTILKKTIFQENLGTLYEKTIRIYHLVKWIGLALKIQVQYGIRAAILCKCDLVSNIVFEFPEMQGIIGKYYAIKEKENLLTAQAIQEHYYPILSHSSLPTTKIGCVLSLSDKIDTIVGLSILKKYPKKNQDPYKIKRLSTGILRIILEKNFSIDLTLLIKKSFFLYNYNYSKQEINKVLNLILHRIYHIYEKNKIEKRVIKSVMLAYKNEILLNIDKKIQSVHQFIQSKHFLELMLIYKRIRNILNKNKHMSHYKNINTALFQTKYEFDLYHKTTIINKKISYLFNKKDYWNILFVTINIKDVINNFFQHVLIQNNNRDIYLNRLSLLFVVKKMLCNISDLECFID